jgi:hypothetical protein
MEKIKKDNVGLKTHEAWTQVQPAQDDWSHAVSKTCQQERAGTEPA